MPKKGQFKSNANPVSLHERVVRRKGKASRYDCIGGCGRVAQEWSRIHGRDGSDPLTHYLPACCSCHQIYDDHWNKETRAKVSRRMKEVRAEPGNRECYLGNKFASGKRTPEQVERMRLARWGR